MNLAPESFEKIATSDADSYFIDLEDVLHDFSFKTEKNIMSYDMLDYSTENTDNPHRNINSFFRTAHQDPNMVCFTRHSKWETGSGIARKDDKIEFRFKLKPKEQVQLKMILHHHAQFMIHKEQPAAEALLKYNDYSQKLTMALSGITTLRKRSTKCNPCDESNLDDVFAFRQKVVNEVECTPSYWASFPFRISEYPFFDISNSSVASFKCPPLKQNVISG